MRFGIRGYISVLGGVWLTAAGAWAQAMPPAAGQPPKMGTPRVHHNVCDLAHSMAGKIAGKGIIDPARAQQTCQTLAPTLGATEQAEFVRCCVERLSQGSAPPAPQQPKAAPDGSQGT